ncbi:UDP-N-acetylmuramate dehydrogenase [Bacteroides sp. 214]|uniref:UDP-N-acetylmuramate dehydrogenase n=1 Tax=Bacteroides sp. 214 TaxID=2302935 RepID=UPI0013D3BD40|nr:UDP-N-acetylmuramate dehydrogenase [Bacteroides sp. 214]NDW11893.1 UDP-N-acetylmuramate dehydrogenase [Bacteroides sp. 214]
MIHVYENYSLLAHNTFGIDVKTARFLEYETVNELRELIQQKQITQPCLHIGGGSNLLFKNDYPGVILHSRITGIEVVEENEEAVYLRVGSGVVWDDFVAYCVARNWYGAENLTDIPGEVGASAVQNIGAYGAEVKDLIVSVDTINLQGEERTYTNAECGFSYRQSIFKQLQNTFVTQVVFKLGKSERFLLDYGTIREELKQYPAVTLAVVREVVRKIRSSKLPDPKEQGNAGSFFMNPVVPRAVFDSLKIQYPAMPHYDVDADRVKIPAGWMIDQCGWKGKAIGAAGVHDKQALVLVNRGGATGEDILRLSAAVQQSVLDKFGIAISPEVKAVG